MHKVALLQSISKQYLSAKHSMRRNKKAVSMLKLFCVSVICLGVFGVYAYTVTISSTRWYDLAQQQKILDAKEFDYNVAKLDVMYLQARLYNEVNTQRNLRYDNLDRVVILETYTKKMAAK